MDRLDLLARTALLAVAMPLHVFAAGGTVVLLDGTASVQRKGQDVSATVPFSLLSGDLLRVATNSKAQIRFEDDSIFAIPGVARLRIDEFRVASRNAGGVAVYTLQEGGFRTVTGSVGKAARDKYELRTEHATVTVRGSAYSALLCSNECARNHKKGFYVRTEDGTVTVRNGAGTITVAAGQVAYVESSTTAPAVVALSPFTDPIIAAGFGIAVQFEALVHPPRIEQEPPASP